MNNRMQGLPKRREGEGPSLKTITTGTKKLPSRLMLHAMQKWGKTSFAAMANKAIFLCTKGEDGLMTLIDSGQLPPVPHYPECMADWDDVLQGVRELATTEHDYKTLVLDTINGAERLCHEQLCKEEYGNDWGKEGFMSFSQGPRSALPKFGELLSLLDQCRFRGMSIILLAHSMPRTCKNPEGADYDRWEPVVDRATAPTLARWVDMTLFGSYEVVLGKEKMGKAKATGQSRLIRAESDPCWEAGNRHGLPSEIECGSSPQEAWANFIAAMKLGKEKK